MALPSAAFEDAHALVIGVSRYRHMPALRPTEDVAGVVAALTDPELCGYPVENVRVLLEERATRAAILDELAALARRTSARSTVLVYFTGHGGRVAADAESGQREAFYLLPVECQSRPRSLLATTAISGEEWTAACNAIPAARLTIVLDCCRAAALAEAELPAGKIVDADLAPMAPGRGRAVMAAASREGSAYLPPGRAHSLFTDHLLRGLRGEAPTAGGVLRVCDLFHYVQAKVVADEPQQRPIFKASLEENYPLARARLAPLALPPPPDDARYDLFLAYTLEDDGDSEWARRVAIPYLEELGLKVCHEKRDFNLTEKRLTETERAIAASRYTSAVFSPAFLRSRFADYQAVLAAHDALESGLPRFIPLLRAPCDLELHRRMTALLDVSREAEIEAALRRLAMQVRMPPEPRLS